jgi:hypothetical protein
MSRKKWHFRIFCHATKKKLNALAMTFADFTKPPVPTHAARGQIVDKLPACCL